MVKRKNIFSLNQSGQTTVEYATMIGLLIVFFVVLVKFVKEAELGKRMATPIAESFKQSYQYGHPKVKGFDDRGGPENHPRAAVPANKNFRIFIYRK